MRSALLVALALLPACGGRQKQANAEMQEFHCKDRIVSYQASKHIAGDELGVQMDCAEAGPRIKRWRTDKTGNRQELARSLTPGEFDDAWSQVQGSGWENLHDCSNGGGDDEPTELKELERKQKQTPP